MRYITSDTHYFHTNIIKYCKRPFKTVGEMNDKLVANFNAVVKPDDITYHLGDFGFADPDIICGLIERLNGKLVILRGNHDKWFDRVKKNPRNVVYMGHYYEFTEMLDNEKIKFCLFHYPLGRWNKSHYGSYMVHGHSHGEYPYSHPKSHEYGRILDAGVDCWNYAPVSIQTIHNVLKKKPYGLHHEGIMEE